LLPTQFGKHFWPDFSIVSGIRIDYLSPTLSVTDLLLVLLFGCFILRWFKTQKKLKSKKHFFVICFIVLFFMCNIASAARPLLCFYEFVKIGELAFLIFYLAQATRLRSQLRYVAFLFAISTVFESLLAVSQYLNQESLNGLFYFFGERFFTGATPGIANASLNGTLVLRPYATFPHPNVLSGYLLISMVFVWSFVLQSDKHWMQFFGALSLVVSSIALLLTFSRVSILLWIVFVFVLLIRMGIRSLKSWKTKLLTCAVIALVLIGISFVPLTREVITRFTQTSFSEESIIERTELLSASWTMIQQHPLLGVGLDNFIPSLAPLQKPLPLNLYLQPVHNIFVLVTTETGVIGLGLFLWLLLATLLRIKNQEARIKGTFFVLILIIVVTGTFDHYWLTLQQGQLLFATVIGLSWAKFSKV